MVSHTVRGLQVIMDALQDTSENPYEEDQSHENVYGRITMKITVNGQNMERVKQFCYLGSLVNW